MSDEMSEARRLTRALEAFAYALRIDREVFLNALRAVGGDPAGIPVTSPYYAPIDLNYVVIRDPAGIPVTMEFPQVLLEGPAVLSPPPETPAELSGRPDPAPTVPGPAAGPEQPAVSLERSKEDGTTALSWHDRAGALIGYVLFPTTEFPGWRWEVMRMRTATGFTSSKRATAESLRKARIAVEEDLAHLTSNYEQPPPAERLLMLPPWVHTERRGAISAARTILRELEVPEAEVPILSAIESLLKILDRGPVEP